jgi:hypothetical protein
VRLKLGSAGADEKKVFLRAQAHAHARTRTHRDAHTQLARGGEEKETEEETEKVCMPY